MIRTAADVNRMANLLAMKIEQRRSDIRKHTDYVRGKRGTLKFASDEFKRYMSDRFSGFADNWCLPVAQRPWNASTSEASSHTATSNSTRT